MRNPSKIKHACVAGLYHGFQFVCLVAMGLVFVFIIFAIIWGLSWQRYE
jgi:hypothetical protein